MGSSESPTSKKVKKKVEESDSDSSSGEENLANHFRNILPDCVIVLLQSS